MGQKINKILKTCWFTAFFFVRSQIFSKFLVKFFPNLKPLNFGQILTFWALVFCKHLHFYSKVGLYNRNWGLDSPWVLILTAPPFQGAEMEYPPKKISKFSMKYLLNRYTWKIKHILATFIHHIESIERFAKLWALSAPPGSNRVKLWNQAIKVSVLVSLFDTKRTFSISVSKSDTDF